jgi:protein-export membrane protein SecD
MTSWHYSRSCRTASIRSGRAGGLAGELRVAARRRQGALSDLAPTVPTGLLDRFLAVMRGSLESDIIIAKGESGIITISPTEAGLARRTSAALDNTLVIVNRRLDGMGFAASAERLGRDRIYVHAPSLQDTSALKELVTKPARLGFHEVHPSISVEEAKKTRPPSGYRIYRSTNREESDQLLRETPVVRGDELKSAQAAFDSRTHEPVIAFTFNGSGARKFGDFTKTHVGRPFAIVLDDKMISAPVIRDAILGGSGQISGNFTINDAKQLAVQLRAGTPACEVCSGNGARGDLWPLGSALLPIPRNVINAKPCG